MTDHEKQMAPQYSKFIVAIYAIGILSLIGMLAMPVVSVVKERDSVVTVEYLEQQVNTLQAEVYALSEAVGTMTASQAEVLNDVTDVLAKVEYFGDTVYKHMQGEAGRK
jgi:hypothetical protein